MLETASLCGRVVAAFLKTALLATVALLIACGGSTAPSPKLAAPLNEAVFPSNRHTTADSTTLTGRRVSLRGFENDPLFEKFAGLRTELNSLDGFGTTAPLYVRFAASLDRSALPSFAASTSPTSPVQIIDLETGERKSFRWVYDPEIDTLFVTPQPALRPKRSYAFIGRGLRDVYGAAFETGSFIDALPLPVRAASPSALQFRAVFTTQSTVEGLAAAALREPIQHSRDEFPIAVSACAGQEHIGFVGRGYLRTADYRVENGRFDNTFDDAALSAYFEAVTVPYRFVLPKGATRAPVMLLQHGLASRKENSISCDAANEYTKHGFAAIGVDAVHHGERGDDGQNASILDNLHMFLGLWGDGDNGYRGEFRFARDAFRQTVIDHIELMRLVEVMSEELDLTGPGDITDGTPDVTDRVFYHGASMGGIIGSLTTTVAPGLEGAALNVPGGRLHNIVLESDLELFELALAPILAGGELKRGEIRRLLGYYQTIMERAEPLNYALHWWQEPLDGRKARSVLIQETVNDVILPNFATEELAAAGGLPLLTPALAPPPSFPAVSVPPAGLAENLAPGVAGGMAQFQVVHAGGERVVARHGTLGAAEPTTQATRFFRSILEGSPTVYRPYE